MGPSRPGHDPVTGKKQYVSRIVMGGKRFASSELARLVAAEHRMSLLSA
jgi:hypothetical protein